MRMRKYDRAKFEKTVTVEQFERSARHASEGALQAMIMRALEREQQKKEAKA